MDSNRDNVQLMSYLSGQNEVTQVSTVQQLVGGNCAGYHVQALFLLQWVMGEPLICPQAVVYRAPVVYPAPQYTLRGISCKIYLDRLRKERGLTITKSVMMNCIRVQRRAAPQRSCRLKENAP